MTPPPTSTRNAAAAAPGRGGGPARSGRPAAAMHATATAVVRGRSARGSARPRRRPPGGQQRTTWSSASDRTPAARYDRQPAASALISSSSAWTATRSIGSSARRQGSGACASGGRPLCRRRGDRVEGCHRTVPRQRTQTTSSSGIDLRSRASARCCATRTAPGVEPTASAVSSADSPTTTRNTRISRCLSGSCPAAGPSRRTARPAARAARDRPPTRSRSGTSATGSDRFRVAARCASITLCDAIPYTNARNGRPWTRYPGRAVSTARHTSCATSSAETDERSMPAEPRAAIAHDQRPDDGEHAPHGQPVTRHGAGDQLVGNVCRLTHRAPLSGRYEACLVIIRS